MKTKRPTKAQIQNAISAVQAQGLQAFALEFTADGGFRVELSPPELAGAVAAAARRRSEPKRFGEQR